MKSKKVYFEKGLIPKLDDFLIQIGFTAAFEKNFNWLPLIHVLMMSERREELILVNQYLQDNNLGNTFILNIINSNLEKRLDKV